jgi:hypothetical protein
MKRINSGLVVVSTVALLLSVLLYSNILLHTICTDWKFCADVHKLLKIISLFSVPLWPLTIIATILETPRWGRFTLCSFIVFLVSVSLAPDVSHSIVKIEKATVAIGSISVYAMASCIYIFYYRRVGRKR